MSARFVDGFVTFFTVFFAAVRLVTGFKDFFAAVLIVVFFRFVAVFRLAATRFVPVFRLATFFFAFFAICFSLDFGGNDITCLFVRR